MTTDKISRRSPRWPRGRRRRRTPAGRVRRRRPGDRLRPGAVRRARPPRRRPASSTAPAESAGAARRPGAGTRSPPPPSIEVGGGVILANDGLVVTQPEEGTFKAFSRHLHPPGLPGRRSSAAPSTARATRASSRSGRLTESGPATQPLPKRRQVDGTNVDPRLIPARESQAGVQSSPPASSRRQCRRSRRRSRTRAPRRPSRREQGRDPGLLDDLALGVAAAEPPDAGRAAASRSAAAAAVARRHQRIAPASGETTSRVRGVAVPRGPAGEPVQPGGVAEREQRDRGVHGQERGRRPSTGSPSLTARVTSSIAGRRRRRGSVPSARAASRSPRGRDSPGRTPGAAGPGSARARRRGRPSRARAARRARRSGEVVGRSAVTGDPVVHPGQAAGVVAGLVVRVCPGMRGVTGVGLTASDEQARSIASSKRPCSWRMNASSPAYHQSSPYAGAARSTISQASSGTVGDPGEGDRRHRGGQQQRVAGVALEVGDQRGGVAARCARRSRARGCVRVGARGGRAAGRRGAGRRRRPGRRTRGRTAPAPHGRARTWGRG